MPTIKLKLNTDSINQALKEVKAYQRKVEQAPQKLIEYLTAQGVEIAKMNVSDMNAYDSGELLFLSAFLFEMASLHNRVLGMS